MSVALITAMLSQVQSWNVGMPGVKDLSSTNFGCVEQESVKKFDHFMHKTFWPNSQIMSDDVIYCDMMEGDEEVASVEFMNDVTVEN